MKTVVCYPIPFNLWEHYRAYVSRFARTFKHYPPGVDYDLYVTCHWGEPIDQIRRWFYGTRVRFVPYYRDGCDIGSARAIANMIEEAFIVGLPTHAYFHREGWLKRLVDSRKKYGPQLFSAAGSFEHGPHLRTSCYGLDAEDFRAYPLEVETRQDATEFECGQNCITRFFRRNLQRACVQVTWDDEQEQDEWRKPEGIFRRGEQNAMLVWDRHTEIFAKATDEEKRRLSALADGISIDSNGEKA